MASETSENPWQVRLLNNTKLPQNGLKRLNKENETESETLKPLNIDKSA
jgi:hypothetical protein